MDRSSENLHRFMNGMFRSLPVHAQLDLFGERISPLPDFRHELEEAGWPVAVNKTAGRRYLDTVYQTTQWMPYSMEMTYAAAEFPLDPAMVVRRLHQRERECVEWYMSGTRQPGDIRPEVPVDTCTYDPAIRHNFSNLPYRKEAVVAGKTHVAVGFVDLSFLLNVIIDGEEGTLRFVGYDRSPFAVAKTSIIWQMLRMPAIDALAEQNILRSILQVWYSSTWEEATLAEFKKAVLEVLAMKPDKLDPEVRRILLHWSKASSQALAKGRELWQALHKPVRSHIGCLRQRADRVDLARYELTGDFGLVDRPHSPSVTMFDCPLGVPPSPEDETVFGAVDLLVVLSDAEGASLLDATQRHLLERLRRLRGWATSGAVTVELHCKAVEIATREIAKLTPWSMSWSNLLDYFNPGVFHRLARACSIHGNTIHFVARKDIIKLAKAAEAMEIQITGCQGRFCLPLPDNPLNTTSRYLSAAQLGTWSEYFFGAARKSGPCNLAIVQPSLLIPISSGGSSSLYFVWTYDAEITFNNTKSTEPLFFPGAPSLQPLPACSGCNGTYLRLSACGRCHSVWYCGKRCQREHWPCHKTECHPRK